LCLARIVAMCVVAAAGIVRRPIDLLQSRLNVEEKVVRCTDIPPERVTKRGKTCSNVNSVKNCNQCKNSDSWVRNKFCEYSCSQAGCGYSEENCTEKISTSALCNHTLWPNCEFPCASVMGSLGCWFKPINWQSPTSAPTSWSSPPSAPIPTSPLCNHALPEDCESPCVVAGTSGCQLISTSWSSPTSAPIPTSPLSPPTAASGQTASAASADSTDQRNLQMRAL